MVYGQHSTKLACCPFFLNSHFRVSASQQNFYVTKFFSVCMKLA